MSSDNASSIVTYMSVSSDSSEPSSWGIPLVNAGEFPEMDPYEEVTQQGQTHPLSPAYVHDPMELDEHVPVYVSEPEHPEYHAPSDDGIQVEDQPYADDASPTAESPGYIDEEPTKDEKEEEHPTPADSSVVHVVDHVPSAGDTEAFETDESAPTPRSPQTRVPFSQTRLSENSAAAAARAPRAAHRAADVGYVRALQAFEHRMMTSIEEVNLRVSYQAHVRRKKSEDFYTQLLDARTDRRDIRLEINVNMALLARLETLETHMSRMEWQRQRAEDDAVRQIMRAQVLEARARIDMVEDAGSSFIIIISICINTVITSHVHCILVIIRIMPVTRQGANDAMTPESVQAMIDRAIQRNSTQDDGSQSSGGGIRRPVQPARVCSYSDFMKCQPLNFKGTEGVVGLSHWLENIESVFHISGCAIENQVKFATCTLLGAALTWWNDHMRTLGHDAAYELALMCSKFLADETANIDKYIGGLPDNIHGNVMFARPKTLDFAIELANDLMDQKLCTYAERHNDNKRKADDSSRNN
ncbi:hypothetical protein Tco_0730661 [Tanacetum coccineum]|uniref:Reverse transcriptase domain-containing protein n=1 Tax=Tanacetum coccineum TaxID=301880 RepID=A0ABQ4YTE3_9ASTR